MASLLHRFAQRKAVLLFRESMHKLFSKYLLVTNTSIAFGLAGTGDLVNQHYEKLRQIRTEWSPVRTRNQCTQGLVFGPIYHFWYIFLDRFLPGYSVRVVVTKVVVDQLIMAPIGVGIFLSLLGLLEGLSRKEIVKDIEDKGKSLLVIEWTFGPATQLFNFFLLPTRFRVLYDSIVCLSFDAYYTYVKYRKDQNISKDNPLGRSLKSNILYSSEAEENGPVEIIQISNGSDLMDGQMQLEPDSSKCLPGKQLIETT